MAASKDIGADGIGRGLEGTEPQLRNAPALAAKLRDRAVALYVAIGLALLVPGILARTHALGDDSNAGALIAMLDRQLQPIGFGHTPRFWMGALGATMMVLLLAYPLRKVFGVGARISVAAWFHLHAMLGIAGPVLVLYHCYFGSGSTPANVALVSTLTVAASGIIGHFVYRRVSAGFHGARLDAQARRDDVATEVQALRHSSSRAGFLDELVGYERHTLPDRVPARRCLGPASGLGERQRELSTRAGWLIDMQGPQEDWSPARCGEAKTRLEAALEAYFRATARASRRAGAERLVGIWRLFHMPLFCILLIAASVHVSKVWGLADEAASERSAVAFERGTQPLSARGERVTGRRPSPIATRPVSTIAEGPARTTVTRASPGGLAEPLVPREGEAAKQPAETGRRQVRTFAIERSLAQAPSVSGASKAKQQAADPVGQLAQRSVGFGGGEPLDPVQIRARLEQLKADPAFDHGRTRFALVGKHREVTCENCHKTTLRDTNQRCAGCHREDDVHRGRRPNCDSCHTPVDWATVTRR